MSMTEQNPLADVNTGFRRDLLVEIDRLGEKPSGQDILERMCNVGHENTNHGQLYPNLDTLVEMGLVEKGEKDLRTNYYRLTSRGEEALESYREFVGDSDD